MREKLGRLVLLEEVESSTLGREYRAARLGPSGLDRLVTVTCFDPAISSHVAATKRLMEEARLAARLQNPGLVRVLGIGRVEQVFYLSSELVEGRTLASVLERCSRDSFPFAADHALMVASRAASALEFLHGKKDDTGTALFHGLLAPSRLIVMYDGEVKLKGLGLWSALREPGLLAGAARQYLAPEQAAGGPGDARSDVYALGLVLREALTFASPDGGDPLRGIAEARVATVSGELVPLPAPLGEVLRRALQQDPAARFAGIAEMRKAIDALLFSGDFTPTTFDIAFFMHTIFRDDIESEARALEEARNADYREFLTEAKPAAPALAPASAGAVPAPTPAPATAPTPAPTAVAEPSASARDERTQATMPAPGAGAKDPAVSRDVAAAAAKPPARESAARAAAGLTLGTAPAASSSRGGLALAFGLLLLLAAAAGAWFFYQRGQAPAAGATTSAPTLTPEAQAAMARVKELEDRIAQLEREKIAAEAKAVSDARQKVEAAAAARGGRVDPAALARAQEEARQRARGEQEKKQQEELGRIAEQRRAEEKRIAEASPSPPAATPATPLATPTPEPTAAATPTPEPTTVAPVSTPTPAEAPPAPGTLVEASDPKLVAPVVVSRGELRYPPFARLREIEGTVALSALVDEKGHVAEVRVVRATPPKMGFEEAALEHARTRRYKPGTKEGVPVRVWVPIVVRFVAKH